MRQIFRNQFLLAIVAYFLIISLLTIPVLNFLQRIKLANEVSRDKLAVYQNLQIVDGRFLTTQKKITCEGNLLLQADDLVTAIHVTQGNLYLSLADNQLLIADLASPEQYERFSAPVLTDFFIDTTTIYGADFFNDNLVRFVFDKDGITAEKVYPKIGRVSAMVRDSKGHYYASGYASGNVTKIIGRDGFLFLTDMDKVVDLEASSSSNLLVARYGGKPSLVSIDLNEKKQTIIEQDKIISSLSLEGEFIWAVYSHDGKSQIGKITGGKLVDEISLNCPFPLKIAVWQDKIFYSSLEDSEGKVYWINKNLHKTGK